MSLSHFRTEQRPAIAKPRRRGSGFGGASRCRSASGRGFLFRLSRHCTATIARRGFFPARWRRKMPVPNARARKIRAARLPENLHRVENSVGLYRTDFSRKKVGRLCLTVRIFRARAGATDAFATVAEIGRPSFGIPRQGRAVSVPLEVPSVSFPKLLFAPSECRGRYNSLFQPAKIGNRCDWSRPNMFRSKNLHPAGSIQASGFGRKPCAGVALHSLLLRHQKAKHTACDRRRNKKKSFRETES